MRGFPFDPPPGGWLAGRVPLWDDEEADGVFETARICADSLHWLSGIGCRNGGILVTAAPGIVYPKDTQGDGVADVRRMALTLCDMGKSNDIANNLKSGWVTGSTAPPRTRAGLCGMPYTPGRERFLWARMTAAFARSPR